MPAYKLIYFNSKGAAEGIRLMFAYKGVDYQDERIESENWPNIKSNTPQGMLPVLEVYEKKYCQSGAIALYVARELGMYGSTSLESLQIDETTDTLTDMTKGVPALFNETDPDKKAAGAKKIIEETFPKFTGFIINRLKANKDGFMVGNQPTLRCTELATYWVTFSGALCQTTTVSGKARNSRNTLRWLKANPKLVSG